MQNQIAVQQALYMKQQQQSQQQTFTGNMGSNSSPPISTSSSAPNSSALDFLKGPGDSSLDFRPDLNSVKERGAPDPNQQQSRLTQWKLNSYPDRKPGMGSADAPDLFSKVSSTSSRPESNNTWGSLATSGWGDDTSSKLTATGDVAVAATSASSSKYPEIIPEVPEFTPGKPWRGGSQMKSVEEDPHLTP